MVSSGFYMGHGFLYRYVFSDHQSFLGLSWIVRDMERTKLRVVVRSTRASRVVERVEGRSEFKFFHKFSASTTSRFYGSFNDKSSFVSPK